jgi:integrase
MEQTRHTFITTAISYGADPLFVAKFVGHKGLKMIQEVYAKYIENSLGISDDGRLAAALKEARSKLR